METTKKAKNILFVDDEAALVKMNLIFLKRHGFTARGTIHAGEALEWFKENPHAFQLVITDISMPEMDGDEMIRKLKGIRPNIKIIVLSGTVHQRESDRTNDIYFLEKPVDPEKLLELIRLLID